MAWSDGRRRSRRVAPRLEMLERRSLLSAPAQVWINDNWVITHDVATAGLSYGDTVANTGIGDDGSVAGATYGMNAFSRIADGIAAVAAGGAVSIVSGTYSESDIAVDRPVVIDGGADRNRVRIVPAAASAKTGRLFDAGVHSAFVLQSGGVAIENLTIDGDGGVGGGGSHNFRGGIVYDYRSGVPYNNITIFNTHILNVLDLGIYLDGGYRAVSSGQIVRNNSIENIGGGVQSVGILLIQANASITGNSIALASFGISTNSIDGLDYAPLVAIRSNALTSTSTGMYLCGLADGSVIGGAAGEGNTISLTGGGRNLGMLVQSARGQITIASNTISGCGSDAAIWLYASSDPAKPALIRNNILTSSDGTDGNPGEGTGIWLTDSGLLFSGADRPAYAAIIGNSITGFVHGIDLYRWGRDPAPRNLYAVIGGAGAGEGNILSGNNTATSTGIRAFDESTANTDLCAVKLISDGSSISGFETGIVLDAGSAEISGNLLGPTNIMVNHNAVLTMASSMTFSEMTIENSSRGVLSAGGGRLLQLGWIDPDGTIHAGALNIDAPLTDDPATFVGLDLMDNGLMVQTADAATRDAATARIYDLIGKARNTRWTESGTGRQYLWGGDGIRSGAAAQEQYEAQNATPRSVGLTTVGVIANVKQVPVPPPGSGMMDVVIQTPFGDQKAGLNSVLVRHTYYGDMDLNTQINADDYYQIDTGFLDALKDPTEPTSFRWGDLDHNGVVNADDYFLIDTGHLTALRGARAQPAPMPAKASPFSTRAMTKSGKVSKPILKKRPARHRH